MSKIDEYICAMEDAVTRGIRAASDAIWEEVDRAVAEISSEEEYSAKVFDGIGEPKRSEPVVMSQFNYAIFIIKRYHEGNREIKVNGIVRSVTNNVDGSSFVTVAWDNGAPDTVYNLRNLPENVEVNPDTCVYVLMDTVNWTYLGVIDSDHTEYSVNYAIGTCGNIINCDDEPLREYIVTRENYKEIQLYNTNYSRKLYYPGDWHEDIAVVAMRNNNMFF